MPRIWTVGHSTRSADEFKDILRTHGIEAVVDVRAHPGSRRYPQFNRETLSAYLADEEIDYHHFHALGGRRRPSANSRNTAWKNLSFRAYADYMETTEFFTAINALLELARKRRVAVMCAEAVWWRCHRSLIADYLKAIGSSVIHIIDCERTESHPYTSAANIVDGKLSYRGLF